MQVSCKIALSLAALGAVAAASDRDAAKSLVGVAQSTIHRVEAAGDGFRAANPEQRLAVQFRNGGVEFTHRSGRFSLTLVGESPVSRAAANQNRLEFTRGALTEWFVNDSAGIEQGFTVASKRAAGPLELQLQVAGDFVPALDHGNVALLRDGKTQLLYAGLHSWDADGRSLPSHALVEGSRIRLLVDDAAARYPVTVDPVVMEAVLTASDGVANDRFASTVAISGDTAVVGAPNDGSRTGQAYVMTRSGSSWSQQTKLPAADGVAGDAFGNSVAIDGNTAVVGAPFGNGTMGAVYVFTRVAGQWSQQAELTAFDGQVPDAYGWSVAISGDTILVGAPQPAFNVGAAYVYTRSGGIWTFQAKLLAPNNSPPVSADFGYSLSLDGDTAVIGAPGAETNQTGRVFVFQRSGTLWSAQATLLANGGGTSNFLNFGASVAVNGDTMIAGAPWCLGFYAPGTVGQRTCPTPLPGAAYVFTRSGVTWSQQAKLISSESVNQDHLGFAVGLSGDTAVIGAPGMNSKAGSSYIFSRTSGVWTQAATLLPGVLPVAGDQYGSAAAFSADTMLVGAPGYTGKGGADVFRLSNVSLSSNPTSQTFTLSGTGCGTQGTFTAPYSGFWTNCSRAVELAQPHRAWHAIHVPGLDRLRFAEPARHRAQLEPHAAYHGLHRQLSHGIPAHHARRPYLRRTGGGWQLVYRGHERAGVCRAECGLRVYGFHGRAQWIFAFANAAHERAPDRDRQLHQYAAGSAQRHHLSEIRRRCQSSLEHLTHQRGSRRRVQRAALRACVHPDIRHCLHRDADSSGARHAPRIARQPGAAGQRADSGDARFQRLPGQRALHGERGLYVKRWRVRRLDFTREPGAVRSKDP